MTNIATGHPDFKSDVAAALADTGLGAAMDRATRRQTAPAGRPCLSCPTPWPPGTWPRASRTTRFKTSTSTSFNWPRAFAKLGGHVHFARTAEQAKRHHRADRPRCEDQDHSSRASRWSARRSTSTAILSRRLRGDRDRPWRVHHPDRQRPPFAHRHAGQSTRPRKTSPTYSDASSASITRPTRRPSPPPARKVAPREIPRSRHGHHGRELRRRRNRTAGHCHQRGQWPVLRLAASSGRVAHGHGEDHSADEDLAVFLKLLPKSATASASPASTNLITGPRRPGDADGPRNSIWSFSTAGDRTCSKARTATCCAAFVAGLA